MNEISEEEKRRILRERRQQKFRNGGATSRLNKITGQAPNSQLSTESPLVTPTKNGSSPEIPAVISDVDETRASSTGNEESTKEMDDLIASISKPPAKKTSPQSRIDSFPSKESSPSPVADPFAMLKSLQGESANDVSSPFELLKAMQEGSANDPGSNLMGEPVDQEMVNYHNYVINRLKAQSILVKWFLFLLPYVYIVINPTETLTTKLPHWLLDPSNFFTIFVAFEIVATSIYYQKLQAFESNNNVNTLQQNSKIAKLAAFIPNQGLPISNLRDKILMGLQYWDVLSMFITDICFVLILMGVFSYI